MNVTIANLRELATNPTILVSNTLAYMTACGSAYIIIIKPEKVLTKNYI
jgi:hypothetical protein